MGVMVHSSTTPKLSAASPPVSPSPISTSSPFGRAPAAADGFGLAQQLETVLE